jgi:general secretion pathway protein G
LDYATPSDESSRHVPWWVSVPLIALMLCFVLYQGGGWDRGQGGTVARRTRAVRDVDVLSTALDRFCRDTGRFPTEDEGLAALVTPPPGANGWRGPYMKRVPIDPWGFPYYYQPHARDEDAAGCAVVSAGPDGKLGTADDLLADDVPERM